MNRAALILAGLLLGMAAARPAPTELLIETASDPGGPWNVDAQAAITLREDRQHEALTSVDPQARSRVLRVVVPEGNASVHIRSISEAQGQLTLVFGVAPPGMVLVPGGEFEMGDTFAEGTPAELPVHTVYVSAFYMDQCEVSRAFWDEVYAWAWPRGYAFLNWHSKGVNHPIVAVNWYDAVKWCNARSEKEGLTPVYRTADGEVYRTGQVDLSSEDVLWDADGYRLPTEAEWEKAARGGLTARRFAWGDTISHSHANYYSSARYTDDASPTRGYHPDYDVRPVPYTSPVGVFRANGYGLHDMIGNVLEWCWASSKRIGMPIRAPVRRTRMGLIPGLIGHVAAAHGRTGPAGRDALRADPSAPGTQRTGLGSAACARLGDDRNCSGDRRCVCGIVADLTDHPALVAVGYEFAKGRIANNTPDHYGLGVVRVEYDPAAQGEDTWKAAELIETARRPQPLRKARVIAFDPHRTNRVYAGSDGCGVAVGIRRPVTEP